VKQPVTPAEWARRVNMIKSIPTRLQVASIVWWDHFSNRQANEAWPHLDALVNAYRPGIKVNQKQTARALAKVGYKNAEGRVRRMVQLKYKYPRKVYPRLAS
jgi:hypothetical protein